ncbi:PKD domain-containing protein [Vibrio parahaemolyticus]|uniref:PKD domain-containing protein n=1 Tax=Vibrio parahaemolyticus TaxID=670 RepID=UPI001EE9F2E8|nr:PKD domain-containing protein [Vibrio parahaemolyticus]MCG6450123.1 PKD domain-containing protein [Vibrio parahaemolyticus]
MIAKHGVILVTTLLIAAGCGKTSDSTTDEKLVPVADAGQPMLLQKGATAVLNASQSYDPRELPLTYNWRIVSKPATSSTSLSDSSSPFPSIYLDAVGNYEFELIVNNGEYNSAPDMVVISDTDSIPVANAGPDKAAIIGQDVTLNGSASFDPDGDPLNYTWALNSQPMGSSAVLARVGSPFAVLTPDVEGEYKVDLVVSDGNSSSKVDSVVVSTLNTRPIANAGPSRGYTLGESVILDGNLSSDADGDPLSFKWHIVSAPNGSNASLSFADKSRVSITPDLSGDYVIALIVNDGHIDSKASTVVLHSGNLPPIANAGHDLSAQVGQLLHLNGTSSTDGNGDILTPQWSIVSRPKNSSVTLGDSHTFHPTLTPDAYGDYVIQLIVSDGMMPSAPDSVVVSTENTAPVANAGQSITVPTGSPIYLDGSKSNDAEGALLNYKWSMISAPKGSSAQLSATNVVSPQFTPDVSGDFVFQLIVNDGFLNSMPATVTVTDNDLPPTANAGRDQSVQTGVTTILNGAASSDPERKPLTYQWSFLSKPSGSGTIINDNKSVNASMVPDSAGDYIVQLTVTDAAGQSATDVVVLRDNNRNTLPVADAGDDTKVFLGSNIVLDGLASFDADGDPLSYQWAILSRPVGSKVQLNNATSASPDFTPDIEGDFVIQLVVSDGKSTSLPDVTVIHDTKKNLPPVANILSPTEGVVGQSYLLDGSQSRDPDGDALSYNWILVSDQNSAAISDPTSAKPTFTPMKAGTYVIALSVNDGVRDSIYASTSIAIKEPQKGAAIPTPAGHNLMMLSSRGGSNRTGSLVSVRESDLTQSTEITSFHGLPYPIKPNDRQGWSVHPLNHKAYQILNYGGINSSGTITEFIPLTQEASMFLSFPELEIGGNRVFEYKTELLFHPDGKSAYTYSLEGGANNAGILVHINFDPSSPNYKQVSVIAEFGAANGNYPGYTASPTTLLYWNGDQTELIVAFGFSRFEQHHVIKIVPRDNQDLSKPWDIELFGNQIWSNGRYLAVKRDTQIMVTSIGDPILTENAPGGTVGFALSQCYDPLGAFLWQEPQVYVLCQGVGGAKTLLYVSNTSATRPSLAATLGSLNGTKSSGIVVSELRSALYSTVNDESAVAFISSPSPGTYLKKPTLTEITKPNYSIRHLVTGGDKLGYFFMGNPAIVTDPKDSINDRFIVTTSFNGSEYGNGAIITYDRKTASILSLPLGYPKGGVPYGRLVKVSSGDYFFSLREFSVGDGTRQRAIARYDSALGNVELITLGDSVNPAVSIAHDGFGNLYTLTSAQTGKSTYQFDLIRINGTNLTSSITASYPSTSDHIPDTELVFDNSNLWFFTDETLRCRDLNSSSDGELVLSNTAAHDPVYAVTFPAVGGEGFFTTRESNNVGQGTIQRLTNDCNAPSITTSVSGLTDQPSTALVAATDGYMYYGTQGGKLMRYDPQTNTVIEVAKVSARSIVGFIMEDSNGDLVGFASNGTESDDQMFAYTLATGSIVINDVPEDTPIDEIYPGFTEIN